MLEREHEKRGEPITIEFGCSMLEIYNEKVCTRRYGWLGCPVMARDGSQ